MRNISYGKLGIWSCTYTTIRSFERTRVFISFTSPDVRTLFLESFTKVFFNKYSWGIPKETPCPYGTEETLSQHFSTSSHLRILKNSVNNDGTISTTLALNLKGCPRIEEIGSPGNMKEFYCDHNTIAYHIYPHFWVNPPRPDQKKIDVKPENS